MLRLLAGPADIASTRFAVSPIFELAMLLRSGGGSPWARRFAAGFEAVRDDPAVQAFVFLHGPGYGASFAAAPPAGMGQTIDDDIAALRGTGPDETDAGLREVLSRRRPTPAVAAVLTSAAMPRRLADAVRTAWDRLLAPDWPRVRAALERDVRYRAERLAEAGWSAALDGIAEGLAYRDGAIEVASLDQADGELGGRGVLLVPSLFLTAERLAVVDDPPWQPTVVYPCRGAAVVFERAATPNGPLAPLLGRTRAALLLALETPSSTTQLAALSGASIGATGDHLRVLLDAGLVARARIARSVVYRRTPLGDAIAQVG